MPLACARLMHGAGGVWLQEGASARGATAAARQGGWLQGWVPLLACGAVCVHGGALLLRVLLLLGGVCGGASGSGRHFCCE